MANIYINIDGKITNLTEDQDLTLDECYEQLRDMETSTHSNMIDAFSGWHEIDIYIE